MEKTDKTLKLLAYCSLIPLLFSLALAVYIACYDGSENNYFTSFARINAYIFSHSYGALLLCLFAGLQIGMTSNNSNRWYVVFNFCLLFFVWFSHHSFADFNGLMFLCCCWLAMLFTDLAALQNHHLPIWYGQLKIKINTLVLMSLGLIALINR